MATKKATSTKKAPVRKSAATKTTVHTVKAEPKETTVIKPVSASSGSVKSTSKLPTNIVNIVFAELVGTFVLTVAALASFTEIAPLYVGLTVSVLVMTIGVVSGAHVNPAVTFGLWSMRKLKTLLVPFYWGAQFLGAMLAVIVMNWVASNSLNLNFNHIWTLDWPIMGVELVGTAVFMFGLAAALHHRELSTGARALGVGASLVIGLVVASTLHSAIKTNDIAAYQKETQSSSKTPEIPHSVFVKGATLNPAVALASVEHTESELMSSSSTEKENTYSRFTSEVILGTLVGAAIGGNLYALLVSRKK
jgi:aquaporin Z